MFDSFLDTSSEGRIEKENRSEKTKTGKMLFFFCNNTLNPLTASILTVFGHFIRGQSFTERSMDCSDPGYPPLNPGPP